MKITLNDLIRFGAIILIFALLFNCKKDNVSTKVPTNVVIKDTSIVNRFIYTGLQTYYLWEDSIPNLKATKYNNADTLNAYLNPQKFFTSLLYQSGTVDKWSFLVNDSTTISNWIAGISKSMGYDFWYAQLGTTSNVVIIVKYVFKGSPAEKADLRHIWGRLSMLRKYYFSSKKFKTSSPIHLTLDAFNSVNMPFNSPVTPW